MVIPQSSVTDIFRNTSLQHFPVRTSAHSLFLMILIFYNNPRLFVPSRGTTNMPAKAEARLDFDSDEVTYSFGRQGYVHRILESGGVHLLDQGNHVFALANGAHLTI